MSDPSVVLKRYTEPLKSPLSLSTYDPTATVSFDIETLHPNSSPAAPSSAVNFPRNVSAKCVGRDEGSSVGFDVEKGMVEL